MRLLAKAYTNEEIASRLAIPVNDVAERASSGMSAAADRRRLHPVGNSP
jgi:hypothetical protein